MDSPSLSTGQLTSTIADAAGRSSVTWRLGIHLSLKSPRGVADAIGYADTFSRVVPVSARCREGCGTARGYSAADLRIRQEESVFADSF
jgi:hypothetical protein